MDIQALQCLDVQAPEYSDSFPVGWQGPCFSFAK
jgi:hypothetical protein